MILELSEDKRKKQRKNTRESNGSDGNFTPKRSAFDASGQTHAKVYRPPCKMQCKKALLLGRLCSYHIIACSTGESVPSTLRMRI